MLVDGFSAGPTDTNCYIVAPGPGQECVVIDPGIGADDDVDARLREHRLKPVAVILTHGHFDHTFSVVPVCGARDIPAYIHPADRGQLTDPWSPVGLPKGIPLFGRLQWTEPDDVRELSGGQVLDLGRGPAAGRPCAGPHARFGDVRHDGAGGTQAGRADPGAVLR